MGAARKLSAQETTENIAEIVKKDLQDAAAANKRSGRQIKASARQAATQDSNEEGRYLLASAA